MKNGKTPDPNVVYPIAGYEKEIYVLKGKSMIETNRLILRQFQEADAADILEYLNPPVCSSLVKLYVTFVVACRFQW